MIYEEFRQKLNTILQDQEMNKALVEDDSFGVILRTHFISEKIMDLWLILATHQENLFKDIKGADLPFNTKLLMANNTNMPSSIVFFFKIIDSIKNQLSHEIESFITDNDIKELTKNLNNMKCSNKVVDNLDIENSSTITTDGISVSFENATNVVKYRMIFCTFLNKMVDNIYTQAKSLGYIA